MLGDKAACYAGKALVRHLLGAGLRRAQLRDKVAGAGELLGAAFAKGHAAALSLYDEPPKTVRYIGGRR